MKVTVATLMLCTALLATTGAGFPFERKGSSGKEKRVQYAAWDDVNVLAHGLLQLGQGLKEHVDKTKVQVRDITAKLKSSNSTVTDLGKLTLRLQEDNKVLKARTDGLEERESQVLNVSSELREKAEELLTERQRVHERMNKLEEKVNGALQGEGNQGTSGNFSDARTIQVGQEAFFSLNKCFWLKISWLAVGINSEYLKSCPHCDCISSYPSFLSAFKVPCLKLA